MKRYIIFVCLAVTFISLFSGCGFWMDGEYEFEEPYNLENSGGVKDAIAVSSYMQMRNAIVNLVETGANKGILDVSNFNGGSVRFFLDASIRYVKNSSPMGAYAVEEISYEIGTNTGEQAVALNIDYRYDRTHIMKIVRSYSMEDAKQSLLNALRTFSTGTVLRVSKYEDVDFQRWVYECALANPNILVEIPQVKTEIYPQKGSDRIISFQFTYTYSTDELRKMQDDINVYLNTTISDMHQIISNRERYSILYDFLVKDGIYILDETNTPAYSVLVNKTGDSAAFASVYAALCAVYDLECTVIFGTYDDQPWSWNMIRVGDQVYYLDLLQCYQNRALKLLSESDMDGYIWDFGDNKK